MSQSAEPIVEWIIQHFDEIFEKHPELKKKLYEKLKEEIEEKIATKEDIKQVLYQIKELREDFNRLSAELKELREETKKLREDFNRLSTSLELRLEALGARWGIFSERAFRKGMRYIIEKFFGGKVSKWEYFDDEGYVYNAPNNIDIDVVIKDSEHILVEVLNRNSL